MSTAPKRSDRAARPRILAAGMMPPPLGGQALMFETAVNSLAEKADVQVIDLQVQSNIGAAGKLSGGKLMRLSKIVAKALKAISSQRHFDTLYYCPSGPSKIGLLKDIALLGLLRPFCRRSVYHFHGTGGIAMLLGMNPAIVALARRTMWKPDIALRCADVTPDDAALCEARETLVVPNGIPDPLAEFPNDYSWSPPPRPAFTFIGAMTEDKGIFDLLEVSRILRSRGLDFEMRFVGEGTDEEIARFDTLVERYGLTSCVQRLGVVKGRAKFGLLASSTLFVFATFFRAETQPLVAIEAFAMGVPVIAYDWRGLNTIIDEGENGFLVEQRNVGAFADAIERSLDSKKLEKFSLKARAKFERAFTLAAFEERIGAILCSPSDRSRQ